MRIRTTLALAAAALAVTGCCNNDTCRTAGSSRSAIDANEPVQAYLATMRHELRDGKVGMINSVMRLSDQEAEVFWEIYQEYEAEYFELGERRRALEYDIAGRIRTRSMDNDAAARLAADYLRLREDQIALLRRYHERISKELSPLRAAQFLQVEHRTGTVVDLVVSSEGEMIGSR